MPLKPFTHVKNRSRCYKTRDAVRVRFAILRERTWFSLFCVYYIYSVSLPAASACAIEGSHVWPAEVSAFYTSLILLFSRYFHIFEKFSHKVLWKYFANFQRLLIFFRKRLFQEGYPDFLKKWRELHDFSFIVHLLIKQLVSLLFSKYNE